MDEVGIGEMINCYTMIPWDLRFDYYDQATNRVQFVMAKPGDEAYAEYWHAFLRTFRGICVKRDGLERRL